MRYVFISFLKYLKYVKQNCLPFKLCLILVTSILILSYAGAKALLRNMMKNVRTLGQRS